jgi:hypothetical protein
LPHCRQYLLDRGLEEQTLPGHDLPVYQDRKLAARPVHQRDLDTRFLPQGGRQTGGVFAGAASDRALTDGDVFHGYFPSYLTDVDARSVSE